MHAEDADPNQRLCRERQIDAKKVACIDKLTENYAKGSAAWLCPNPLTIELKNDS